MKTTKCVVFWAALCVFMFGPFAPAGFCAERYPDRPIQFIVSQVAGATMDVSARILATELEKILGTTVVVVNKPGAATVLGTEAAVRAKKDGYTILITGSSSMTFAPITSPESVHYDPAKDLEFLGLFYYFPNTITVRRGFSLENLPGIRGLCEKESREDPYQHNRDCLRPPLCRGDDSGHHRRPVHTRPF